MCGIAGIFDPSGKLSSESLAAMTRALAHRGPDAEGLYSHEAFHLGHRRLSIIDLSNAANQPFYSACGRYVMAYNGEVYNFKEIARDLNLQCRTTSDTEVIIEAFAKLGPEFVNRLNGMFAIAIHDRLNKRLHIFRDRIGIKPINYYWDGSLFLFASELKSIRTQKKHLNQQLDRSAIGQYLNLGYIPAPHTAYTNTFKFPSGHRAELDTNGLRLIPYWQANSKVQTEVVTNETAAIEQLEGLIDSSVKYRMVSDVPFGTFLSGGIDSSLVTALAQKNSTAPINTFNIKFAESTHDESHFARAVAEHLGTRHHELTFTEREAIDLIPDITKVYDEPFADSSAAPTMLVSKLARQHVTMTLSGDGGDELFLGYGAHVWANRFSNRALWTLRKPLSVAMKLGPERYKRVADLLNAPHQDTLSQHIFSQEQYLFSFDEVCQYAPSLRNTALKFSWPEARTMSAAEQQAYFDLTHYLQDDLLIKVDRASMRYALETRVPLLDHRIIEFALNLSPGLKIKNGTAKYLLKNVLYRHVPKSLFDRPKWGFSIPLGQWLRGPLRDLMLQYAALPNGIIDPCTAQNLISRFEKGETRLYNRIWLLIVLNKWMEEEGLLP